MSVRVPAGWVALRFPIYSGIGEVCLAPRRGHQVVIFGCAGVAIYFGRRLPGAENAPYAPDQDDGWYPATDAHECPFVKPSGTFDGIRTTNGFDKGLKPVGSHQANWNRWSADCTDGKHPFHPQAWYLPKSKVVIFDYLEHPETAAILASAEFASGGAQLSSYFSARLVSATGSKLVVQPLRTYTSDAKGEAYAKAHGTQFPFPNDYLDVEYGPKRTIAMNSSTACQGGVSFGKSVDGGPVACSEFSKARKDLPVAIWVLPGTATAEAVIEMYRP